jgi:hypothetical protein
LKDLNLLITAMSIKHGPSAKISDDRIHSIQILHQISYKFLPSIHKILYNHSVVICHKDYTASRLAELSFAKIVNLLEKMIRNQFTYQPSSLEEQLHFVDRFKATEHISPKPQPLLFFFFFVLIASTGAST